MHQINRVLRAARAMSGLSKREMAERVGISPDYYSHLECNIATPGKNTLKKISRATGVSVEAVVLMNMSVPVELDQRSREMFNEVKEKLIGQFVSRLMRKED